MKTFIIYGCQYGSTKRYAECLSEMTGVEAFDYKKAKGIDGFDRERTADAKAMLEANGQQVDFVDFGASEKII